MHLAHPTSNLLLRIPHHLRLRVRALLEAEIDRRMAPFHVQQVHLPPQQRAWGVVLDAAKSQSGLLYLLPLSQRCAHPFLLLCRRTKLLDASQ